MSSGPSPCGRCSIRAEPANTVTMSELANAYDLATVLHDRGKGFAESLRDQERAFALRQAMVEARPRIPRLTSHWPPP